MSNYSPTITFSCDSLDAPCEGEKCDGKPNAFIYVVLWIAALGPYPNVLVGSRFDFGRVLDLLMLTIMLYFFLSGLALNVRFRFPRSIQMPIAAFCLLSMLVPVAYWYSSVLRGEPTGVRDYFELLRFPIMLVVSLFLVQTDLRRTSLPTFIRNAYIIPFWIIVFLCVAEFVGLPLVSNVKAFLWAQSKNTLMFSGRRFRISGTLVNPNWFSLYLNMMLGLFLFFRDKRPANVAGIVACIGLIALTGSLTGLSGLLFLSATYLVVSCRRMIRRPLGGTLRLLFVVGLVLLGFHLMWSIGNARVGNALKKMQAKGSILGFASAEARFHAAKEHISMYQDEPRPLGYGPSKYFVADVIDNQYVEYLMRYGIVGFSLLMLVYARYCVAALSLRARTRDPVVRDYAFLAFILTPLLLVYFLAGQFADNLRLAILYLGLVVPAFVISPDAKAVEAC